MGMHIDFKVTIWERICVPKPLQQKVKELIKKGHFKSADDLYHWLDDINDDEEQKEIFKNEMLFDTTEQLTPEENNGEPTIEAFIDDNIVYENRK